MNNPLLSVSILDADRTQINLLKKSIEDHIDFWHVDVMDGKFVENVKDYDFELLRMLSKPLDIHLMVDDIMRYLILYENIFYQTQSISIHYESSLFSICPDSIKDCLKNIKKKYCIKFALTLNPSTEIDANVKNLIAFFDFILVMTVVPGKGGQTFMKEVMQTKAAGLKELFPELPIMVDGGIKPQYIEYIKKNTNIQSIVVGSYISRSNDPLVAYNALMLQ